MFCATMWQANRETRKTKDTFHDNFGYMNLIDECKNPTDADLDNYMEKKERASRKDNRDNAPRPKSGAASPWGQPWGREGAKAMAIPRW